MVGAANALEVTSEGRSWHVPMGRPFVIGRDTAADLKISDTQVSRRHVVLRGDRTGWALQDQSSNGTFVDGQRVVRHPITGAVTVRLGTSASAPALRITPASTPGHRPALSSTLHPLGRRCITIGRDSDNDVVLHDVVVSRQHAELRRTPDDWTLVDLNTPNGTYVDGRRVRQAAIGPRSLIGIGHALLRVDGNRLVEQQDRGNAPFRAESLVVRTPEGKQLLGDVTFSLDGSSLLAVIGPSGAGKSTLLRALTGVRPADGGRVEYAGRDLYADYDELRHRIGVVPQDDILHPQLTVRRALSYAAQLRFPAEVSAAERRARIDEVLGELGLTAQRDQRISSLSGGQRKRTSVALELLTKPSLLFLDEPTSGLDPGLDKSVMHTLRDLADGGRTVIVVTHSVANLDLCDRLLVLAPGGGLAYYGPPGEALAHFGVNDYADLFLLLQKSDDVSWTGRFRRSPHAVVAVSRPTRTHTQPISAPARAGGGALSQFTILCRRYVNVIAADRQYTIFMAVLPLLLSVLAHALPGDTGLSIAAQLRGERGSPASLLLVLVVGASLMGSAASIREIVKEREIFRRERAIGLSRGAYLASKIAVLTIITSIQAAALGYLGTLGRPAPDTAVILGSSAGEIIVALIGVAVSSSIIGLAVSAVISNADRGMPLLVLLAMLQLILSSALLQVSSSPLLGPIAWLVPARWGFALGAATVGLPNGPDTRSPYADHDPLWNHDVPTWFLDVGGLLAVSALFIAIMIVTLKQSEPHRRRRA